VRLCEGTLATRIASGRVITPRGTIACESIVVAVDGRLEAVLPELAERVRTARLQMLATAPADDVCYPRPVYLRNGYEYWQQLPNGSIALGGFRDRGGDAEWTSSTRPSPAIQELLEGLLRERIGTRAPVTRRWAASVGYTVDGEPIIEEVRPRVYAIGGYSGTGNIIGAVLARQIARTICRAGDPHSLQRMHPKS
jgi:gamma-glutamylputrescine oxidase